MEEPGKCSHKLKRRVREAGALWRVLLGFMACSCLAVVDASGFAVLSLSSRTSWLLSGCVGLLASVVMVICIVSIVCIVGLVCFVDVMCVMNLAAARA